MSTDLLRKIVKESVKVLFDQITGGRISCESEATLQLHLGRIISQVSDLLITQPNQTISLELEKPLPKELGLKGRIDIWFSIGGEQAEAPLRCAMELKFFKKANHREPNNRYDVFKDIARLERCNICADVAYMLVATDHDHYISQEEYSPDTADFDFRNGKKYSAGNELTYRTGNYGNPISLKNHYEFIWSSSMGGLKYLLLEVPVKT
ncbi:hypothetical protein ACR9YC_13270 [Parasphingorhabdus sp. DH2-15]|uniref:hypothetical protein n=1 Tax=Parasphingorhabdus sp. DH2-15 TaxID=3444112 RepID=UPI003F685C84